MGQYYRSEEDKRTMSSTSTTASLLLSRSIQHLCRYICQHDIDWYSKSYCHVLDTCCSCVEIVSKRTEAVISILSSSMSDWKRTTVPIYGICWPASFDQSAILPPSQATELLLSPIRDTISLATAADRSDRCFEHLHSTSLSWFRSWDDCRIMLTSSRHTFWTRTLTSQHTMGWEPEDEHNQWRHGLKQDSTQKTFDRLLGATITSTANINPSIRYLTKSLQPAQERSSKQDTQWPRNDWHL